ncbi:ATP-binding cassette domain-containing protein [Primorskyibacter flagellatus]|uniref:ATP-binding cassette, subfamily B n=1 Tax=Primorskyibacter flagellatus TaxID=1387277 RepID=A0A1W2DVI4_9RHOB|nr:ABC transporter ATP-binding protein [Primorskyibacter flagellatus]SMD01102.1 ATP-binding cassette, subfamily B [Primorskyibacter flagellatus]
MKQQPEHHRPKPVKSLFERLGRGGTIAMATATGAVIAAGFLANLPAVYLGDIVDMIVENGAASEVWPIFLMIVAVLLVRILLVVMQKFLVERTAVGLQRNVTMGNLRKILSLRVDAIQSLRSGEVAVLLDKRVHGMVRWLKLIFLDAIPLLAIAIPAVIFAFRENFYAGGVILIVLALSAIVTVLQIRSQKGIRITLIQKAASLAGQITELLSHLDFVRASDMAKNVRSRFDGETRVIKETEFLHHKWMMAFDAIKGLIEDLGQALVVGIGIFFVVGDNMTPGTILTLAMLYKSAAIPLQQLHRVADEMHEAALHIDAANKVIDAADDPGLSGAVAPAFVAGTPVVHTRGLSLRRTALDGTKEITLDEIDLDIHAGEVIGIAGPSGGGKTTLLKAILGLLPDYDGKLEVFGAEVRDVAKGTLADLVSYGPQKPYVRKATVRANIVECVVREGDVENAVLEQALTTARLDLPLGKELTERGDNISPGQVQRLSLARVFAKKTARLVVLDEATSGLDGKTQAELMDELRCHAQGRAMVMVAHRLDTLVWADRIVVLDRGRIVQSGHYEELAATPGMFANLLGEEVSKQPIAAE